MAADDVLGVAVMADNTTSLMHFDLRAAPGFIPTGRVLMS